MKFSLVGQKSTRTFEGTLDEAIAEAIRMEPEMDSNYGVVIKHGDEPLAQVLNGHYWFIGEPGWQELEALPANAISIASGQQLSEDWGIGDYRWVYLSSGRHKACVTRNYGTVYMTQDQIDFVDKCISDGHRFFVVKVDSSGGIDP